MPYNAAKGYYEPDYAGQSDQERTQAAMKYYANNGLTSQLAAAVNYQKQKGYSSTPKTTVTETPKTTTAQTGTFTNNNNQQNTQLPTTQTVKNNMAVPSSSYYIPYEQAIKDSIASYPTYTKKTDAEMEAEAAVCRTAALRQQRPGSAYKN